MSEIKLKVIVFTYSGRFFVKSLELKHFVMKIIFDWLLVMVKVRAPGALFSLGGGGG